MANTVRSELETRLSTWAAAQSPAVLVSYEAVPFNKPTDFTAFVQCFLIPNVTLNTEVSGSHMRELGIFQVNVWCKEGEGSGKIDTLVKSVIDAFPIIPKVGSVSIEQTPHASAAILDNGWRIVPVTIKYRLEI